MSSKAALDAPRSNLTDEGSNAPLLRLILGVALAKYNFDPNYSPELKSPVFRAISNDLAAFGLTLDVKTIRAYLKSALDWAATNDKLGEIKHKHSRRRQRSTNARRP